MDEPERGPGWADDVAGAQAAFTLFADSLRWYTPRYQAIARRVAAEPDVAALLLHARPEQRNPVLLLAAVHDLLLRGLDHPLGDCYPTVVDEPTGSADEAAERFVDLCRRHQDLIVPIVATRATQTNEVGRSAALRPAMTHLGRRHGALALVEVGASAGLNLWFDRYRITYTDGDGQVVRSAGPDGAGVELTCRLRGEGDPPLEPGPDVRSRTGLDQSPVDLRDPGQDRWLLACIWPDEPERFHRVQAAIAAARTEPGPVRVGDAVDDVAALIAEAPGGAHPVVYHSWVLSYLPPSRQRAFSAELDRVAATRPLTHLWLEHRDQVPGLDHPRPRPIHAGATEVVAVERTGRPVTPERLAEMHPHGRWLDWQAG